MPLNKDRFIQNCVANGVTIENATMAWEKIISLKNHMQSNTQVYSNLQQYSQMEKLRLREVAAEHGLEWTPNEVDNAIQLIGIIQNNEVEE